MKSGVIIFLMLVSCSGWKKYSWKTTTYEHMLSILPQEQKNVKRRLRNFDPTIKSYYAILTIPCTFDTVPSKELLLSEHLFRHLKVSDLKNTVACPWYIMDMDSKNFYKFSLKRFIPIDDSLRQMKIRFLLDNAVSVKFTIDRRLGSDTPEFFETENGIQALFYDSVQQKYTSLSIGDYLIKFPNYLNALVAQYTI